MKKIISLILTIILIISLFVPCYAASSGFYSSDMVHSAYTFKNVDGTLERVDYTDKLTVSSGTFSNKNCTIYQIPIDTTNTLRYVSSYQVEDLNATHQYSLDFDVCCNVLTSTGTTMLGVYLVFYDGSTILREQELYSVSFDFFGWQNVSFKFKPNTEGLGGYNTRLEFRFICAISSPVTYRLSERINFSDDDDNASWFEKIINAIKELPSNFANRISTFFENLGNKLTEVKENIINLGTIVLDGLEYLFIPSDDYFINKLNYLKDYFENKFGLFALPITLTVNLISAFNNIGDSSSGVIPVLPIEFFGHRLFPFDEINIRQLIMNFNDSLDAKIGIDLYQFYLIFVDTLIVLSFARLVKRKYNAMFDTGSFDEAIEIYNNRKGG